jgi:hypothetical protein
LACSDALLAITWTLTHWEPPVPPRKEPGSGRGSASVGVRGRHRKRAAAGHSRSGPASDHCLRARSGRVSARRRLRRLSLRAVRTRRLCRNGEHQARSRGASGPRAHPGT